MRFLVASVLFFTSAVSYSQNLTLDSAEVKNSTVEFNGGKYNGYLIDFNAPQDIVEDAIKERFKLQGIKPKETKGFMVYRNVVMPRIDPVKPMDAFIKVERKSRKEKEQTTVYFIATRPGEIGEDKLKAEDAGKTAGLAVINKGDAFLTGMIPDVKLGMHNRSVTNKQSQLKKEEKKLGDLVDELAEMEKKLKKLQSDIEFNKKAQERQAAEIENAKKTLNELIANDPSKGG